MPKQTALNTIERLIREDRPRETDRQPRSGLVTINRLLNASGGGRRKQERVAFNAASAGEAMDLVRNMGELAAERRQAEAAPVTSPTPQGRDRLTPAAQAEFMRRSGAQGQLTPYQQYMMQVSNAQRDALETTEKRQAAGERTTGPYRAPNAYQQYRLGQENRRREEAARVRENMPSGWKNVGNTLGGMAAGFVSGVGNPLAVMARIMEMPDDLLYAITKKERFNLDRAPGLRDSAALRASDDFSSAAQEAADKAGPLGKMLISGAEAAGNMMSSAGIYGQALGSIANAGGAARLAEIAESSPLLTSKASRRGAKMALDILSNPGNFGISLGSGVNSYSRALENGATVDQALANGVSKGLLEYFNNKMFNGTPFEDAVGEKGYVTRLVEHLADRISASGILEAFNRSTGGKVVNWILDKAGEGMEETITGFGEPLIDRITYNPKADLATADELADEFLGGVVLSLLLSGGERLSSWQKSGNGISEREVIDRLEEMGIPSEVAREYAAQTAQAASVLMINAPHILDYQTRSARSREEAIATLLREAERHRLLIEDSNTVARLSPEKVVTCCLAEEPERDVPDPGYGLQLNGTKDMPVQVGSVTTINHPYIGEVPVQRIRNRENAHVPEESVTRAERFIASAQITAKERGRGFKTILTKLYEQVFKKKTGVPVDGMTFNGKQYFVDIGNQVPGKVISDPNLSAEKLALLDILPEVVQNAQYVGSGAFISKGGKEKPVVRYDLF